jgi:hypothetical protein
MNDWKYKLGEFVTPITGHSLEHAVKMIVVGRVTEEYEQHTERYYICAHYKLGDFIRSRMSESEITVWTK